MTIISDTGTLAAFCRRLARETFVTVDCEFMREKTYWSQLCLLQMAGSDEAAAVDTLAPGLDLAPVLELFAEPGLLKVFHAGRQDIEIFHHLNGAVPAPIFDTQVAAMVCGFGDAASYETLVAKLAKGRVDKSARFTDWAHRPLTRRQIDYAISDVTHLRVIYEKLRHRLEKSGRAPWVGEEMAVLADPATYRADPREAWRRLKLRRGTPRFVAILREIAAWRENEAQRRDVPRNRVVRDEALLEIAAHAPSGPEELARTRGLSGGFAGGAMGKAVLAAVARGQALPEADCPRPPEKEETPRGIGPVVDLLKVLLKMKCESHNVAQKLVASTADLQRIAVDDGADVPALRGWRRQVFGEDALDLKHGRIALVVEDKALAAVELEAEPAASEPDAQRRAG